MKSEGGKGREAERSKGASLPFREEPSLAATFRDVQDAEEGWQHSQLRGTGP